MTLEQLTAYSATDGTGAWLIRDAMQHDWIDPGFIINKTGVFAVRCLERDSASRISINQYRAWLNESLASALIHEDKEIVLQATLQAWEYAGRLRGMGYEIGSIYSDALYQARRRLEMFIQR